MPDRNKNSGKNLCAKCVLEVKGGDGVPCALCEHWSHTKCIEGMTTQFVDCHDGLMRLHGGSAYLCPGCRKAIMKFNANFREHAAKIAELEKNDQLHDLEILAIKEKMDRLMAELDQARGYIAALEKEIDTGMQKAVQEVKEEVSEERRQVEDKASNVVLYGLVESTEKDARIRKEKDEENVRKLAAAIGVEIDGNVDAKYRAGRHVEGAKPRPLIVTIEDDETRARLLKNAPLLGRKTEWKGVFLSEDLTKKQREENSRREVKLREEAEKKNDEAKKDGKTGGSYKVKGRGERRRVVWWWDSREEQA